MTHKVPFKCLRACLKGTRVLSVGQGLPALKPDPHHGMIYEYGGNPIEKAVDLTGQGYKTVTVNAASAYHAGGGFTSGGRHALEEAFCSQSSLYASLEQAKVRWQQGQKRGLYSNDWE